MGKPDSSQGLGKSEKVGGSINGPGYMTTGREFSQGILKGTFDGENILRLLKAAFCELDLIFPFEF